MSQAQPEAGFRFVSSPPPAEAGLERQEHLLVTDTSEQINLKLFGDPELQTTLAASAEQARLDRDHPDHLLSSAEIVRAMQEMQTRRAAWLNSLGVNPELRIFICGENQDNESYLAQAKSYGALIGVDVAVSRSASSGRVDRQASMTAAELETMSAISRSRQNSQYRGELVLGPSETIEGWRWIQATAGGAESHNGDLDGVGSLIPSDTPGRTATTSEAMVVYAEHLLGGKLEAVNKGEVGVAGNGGVGGPLRKRILAKRGIAPGVSLETAAQVQQADELLPGSPLRVLFATARARGVIHAGSITPPTPDGLRMSGKTLIIDAGNAPNPETGIAGGNTDESTLPGSHVYATPFKNGVGPVTVALLFDRLLDKAEQDYYAEQARLHRTIPSIGWLATPKMLLRRFTGRQKESVVPEKSPPSGSDDAGTDSEHVPDPAFV